MRKRKASTQTDEVDRDLLNHIRDLGLGSVAEYREWCGQNGFSKKLKKHWKQLCQERFHVKEAAARKRLDLKKREKRNLLDILTQICNGQLAEEDVTQTQLKRLCEAVRIRRGPQCERQVNRKALLPLLSHLQGCRAKFFGGSPVVAELGQSTGNTYIEALALISAHASSWLRPVEDWKPRSHSARKQFASLLRHLFVQHDDMPLFFDSVWLTGRNAEAAEQRSWYLHVGRGQSIRQCKLPVFFTKKMAHRFMHAPPYVTVRQAIRWGQIHGLGGDERLTRAIFGTRLIDNFDHEEFWETVIRWFVAHPMLDRAQIGPIIDYLHHQRFIPQNVFLAHVHREESPPPQPNLSMKGRTPESLLRRVNEWHRTLGNDNTLQVRQWSPSGIEGFEFTEGSQKSGNLKCWTIREVRIEGGKSLVKCCFRFWRHTLSLVAATIAKDEAF